MRNKLLGMVITFVFGFPGIALAIDHNLCFKYGVVYDDADAGDYWTTTGQTTQTARGILIKVTNNNTSQVVYHSYASYENGCVTLDMNSLATYEIRGYSVARLRDGNLVIVNDDPTNLNEYEILINSSFQPAKASQTYYFQFADTNRKVSNLAAAGGYALHKRNGGLASTQIRIFNEDECPGGFPQCATWDDTAEHAYIYFGDGSARTRKYVIAHEMGHAMSFEMDQDESNCNYNCANGPDCGETDTAVHDWTSKEWQTAACVEGFAYFYSATVWNTTTETDCEYYYSAPADFNPGDGEPDTNHYYDCASGSAFMETECGTPYEDRGVEVDWVRFFWALKTDLGLSFDTIAGIYDDADPRNWWAHQVYPRLRTEADTAGVDMTEWDDLADEHGVDY